MIKRDQFGNTNEGEDQFEDVYDMPPEIRRKRAEMFFQHIASNFDEEWANYREEYLVAKGEGWFAEMWDDLRDRFVATLCSGNLSE